MKKINIAIDGHSGCGKSSTAKNVANSLGYKYIDTGAMYRAVTYAFIKEGLNIENEKNITSILRVINIDFNINSTTGKYNTVLNGEDVESEIRSMKVAERVSEISANKQIRKKMLELQRFMAKDKGVVMDGRDIGTRVLPNAELKIFMTADASTRAKRRKKEMEDNGTTNIIYEEVLKNLLARDSKDTTRKESPLRQASDAKLIDTTNMVFKEQVDLVLKLASQIINME